jgi:HAE1 family hydrophobic/amphiphilic exporter-1
MAFILGILPLVLATGTGSAGRNSMGTAVFGGMIFSTLFNLLLIPVLYIVIINLKEKAKTVNSREEFPKNSQDIALQEDLKDE